MNEKRWIFLTDGMQREIALHLPSNSLAQGLIMESSTLATPMGAVFDYWNQNEQQLAADLLISMIDQAGEDRLIQATVRVELYLITFESIPQEVIAEFKHFLGLYGLSV